MPTIPIRATLIALAAVHVLAACGDDGGMAPPPGGQANLRPTANFTADASVGEAPLAVQFDASASVDPDGSIVSYAWEFGDGNTGSGQTTTHTYSVPGPYTPRLTVTDDRTATHTRVGSRINVNSPAGDGPGEIQGTVYHDADADGARGGSEATIPAMVVFLDEDGDGERDAAELVAVTGDDGFYRFTGLQDSRSYTVTQALTLGWTNTSPGAPGGVPPLPDYRGPAREWSPGTARIIGGDAASPDEFPFQVALVTAASQFQFCGGTFIARRWVMTAAHCVTGAINDISDPDAFKILAGTNDLRTGGALLDVERILVHPNFSASAFVENDVALVELTDEFMYPRIELLTRDGENQATPGTTATVIGWGLTSNNGQGSEVLKKLEADIITNADCQTLLGNNILDATICAGMQGSAESVCNGDSGGPLMVPYRGRWLQVGIVSFGANICFQPTAFARVSALADYVIANVPPERSGAVVVNWSGGSTAVVDFGNYR